MGGLCEGKAGKEGMVVRVEPHQGLHSIPVLDYLC